MPTPAGPRVPGPTAHGHPLQAETADDMLLRRAHRIPVAALSFDLPSAPAFRCVIGA
jgi:hypothetical protein